MNRRLEASEIWFYGRMLKIPWKEYARKEKIVKEMGTKMIHTISWRCRFLKTRKT